MANVTGPRDEFIDLGKLKKVECKKLQEVITGLLEDIEYPKVCVAVFEHGKVTLGERDLKRICEEDALAERLERAKKAWAEEQKSGTVGRMAGHVRQELKEAK